VSWKLRYLGILVVVASIALLGRNLTCGLTSFNERDFAKKLYESQLIKPRANFEEFYNNGFKIKSRSMNLLLGERSIQLYYEKTNKKTASGPVVEIEYFDISMSLCGSRTKKLLKMTVSRGEFDAIKQ